MVRDHYGIEKRKCNRKRAVENNFIFRREIKRHIEAIDAKCGTEGQMKKWFSDEIKQNGRWEAYRALIKIYDVICS